jgi:hypothetical protein
MFREDNKIRATKHFGCCCRNGFKEAVTVTQENQVMLLTKVHAVVANRRHIHIPDYFTLDSRRGTHCEP